MKILFCSRWFPYPPDNGSKIRIFNLIKQLSLSHEVDLISFTSEALIDESLETMSDYCRQVKVVPYRSFEPKRLTALAGFFSMQPRSVIDTYSDEFQMLVEQAARQHKFDLVIASQIDMVRYVLALPYLPKIFEEIELTIFYEQVVKEQNPLKKLRSWLTWWKLSQFVRSFLASFSGCTVVSEVERTQILQVTPGYKPIAVIPNGVDLNHHLATFGPPVADTLVYSGALTYGANFDAMDFFLREIFPLIQAQRPQVKLYITGKLNGVPVNRLPSNNGVIFTGYLNDIRPQVAQSWVSIVPLRFGGGTRLKVLESLALGTPVVATSKGAEGLDLVAGKDLLIAVEPADFAAAVLRLLQEAALRDMLSGNGRQAVKKYDWQTIGQSFCNFVERVAVGAGS